MTFDQAQLYIKMFILQHYDKNIEDVIPHALRKQKVSDLVCDIYGDWKYKSPNYGFVFWASKETVKLYNRVCLNSENNHNDTDFNILDYITLGEEH